MQLLKRKGLLKYLFYTSKYEMELAGQINLNQLQSLDSWDWFGMTTKQKFPESLPYNISNDTFISAPSWTMMGTKIYGWVQTKQQQKTKLGKNGGYLRVRCTKWKIFIAHKVAFW